MNMLGLKNLFEAQISNKMTGNCGCCKQGKHGTIPITPHYIHFYTHTRGIWTCCNKSWQSKRRQSLQEESLL